MDKYPLFLDGHPAGELTAVREGLYTCFGARCHLPEGLWCAWAVGERGDLRLGVLEPEGAEGVIRRRFSDRLTAPLGRLLRGEARRLGAEEPERWEAADAPEQLFRAPWLRRRLKGVQGALTRRADGRQYLALPYDKGRPFPLATLFCFARLREVEGRLYVVYAFDREDRPVF